MNDRPSGPRCAALVGPYLSGKTTLLEALLFAAGATNRRGTQKDGNTVGDHTPEARARQMSTEINVAHATFLGDPWIFLDCPGSVELAWEAQMRHARRRRRGGRVRARGRARADLGAALQVPRRPRHPAHGVHQQARQRRRRGSARCWRRCRRSSARPLVLRQVPLPGPEGTIAGYVDLVSERAYRYKPGQASDLIKLPDDTRGRGAASRAGLLEKLADFDDKLLEQLLEDVQPSKDEIYRQLTAGFAPRPDRAGVPRRGVSRITACAACGRRCATRRPPPPPPPSGSARTRGQATPWRR